MPTLRWLGFSRVTSLPPTRMAPEVGSSKPATILRTVVFPQPDGPRKETNSPGAASRLKSCTTVFWPKDFLTCWIERKGSAMLFAFFGSAGLVRRSRRKAREQLYDGHAGPGDGECNDGERCR